MFSRYRFKAALTPPAKRCEALHVAHLGSDMEPGAGCNIFEQISSHKVSIDSGYDRLCFFSELLRGVIASPALGIEGQGAGSACPHKPVPWLAVGGAVVTNTTVA